MFQTIRRPEEILAYRTLQQILVSKPSQGIVDRWPR